MGVFRQQWVSGTWLDAAPEPNSAQIVDSFLLRGGRVPALEDHRDRFIRAASQIGYQPGVLAWFWSDAVQELPRDGTWFPRLEAHKLTEQQLVLWVRHAPQLSNTLSLWVPKESDPRSNPLLKGPDLEVLAGLRQTALSHEAQDALLKNRSGLVLEAAHAALLWWDGDTLCYPDPSLAVFPSITSRRILVSAKQLGIEMRAERRHWKDLCGLEVWSANALHGIRPVMSWVSQEISSDSVVPDADRLTLFRNSTALRLDQLPDTGGSVGENFTYR